MEKRLLRLFLRLSNVFLRRKDRINIALAGGKTPMEFYRLLSKQNLPWEKFSFFLTDERFVPLDSDKSNYKNIKENLGEKAKLYPVDTSLPIDRACVEYSKLLPESLDIALLGVGEDGHTASLFPKAECKKVTEKVCISSAPDGTQRVSLSYEYLNLSCVVIFALKGPTKTEAYQKLLRGDDIPASKVKGRRKTFVVFQP